MPLQTTGYKYIVLDDETGEAWVQGTAYMVRKLMANQRIREWSPGEMQFYLRDITTSMVYSALAYYHDHQDEIDTAIEERDEVLKGISREQMEVSALMSSFQ